MTDIVADVGSVRRFSLPLSQGVLGDVTLTIKAAGGAAVYGPTLGTVLANDADGNQVRSWPDTAAVAAGVYTYSYAWQRNGVAEVPLTGALTLSVPVPGPATLVTPPVGIKSFSTSGGMKREEMVRRAKALAGEVEGTDGAGSPFEWDSLLSEAADDLCRGTYCFYTSFTLPLVAAQANYCFPPLFKLAGAFLKNSVTGDESKLLEATKRDIDGYSIYGWPYVLGQIANNRPAVYLWNALSDMSVYPAPSIAVADTYSLVTEGWATTEGQWDNAADTCPLPARLHPTVIDGAVLLRAAQFPGTINVALIQVRYNQMRAKAEREASTYARRQVGYR